MSFQWPTLALEDCLEALIDYRGKTPEKTTCGIPLVTAKVIKGGRIETPTEFIAPEDYDSWMRRGIPVSGDVVMTTEAPLGEVAQLGRDKVALAQRVITLRGKKGFLDNSYLLYLLQTEEMQEQLKARATGTTVLGIKQSELRKISVRVPPLGIQLSAAVTLKALDDRITLLRETNATLEAIAQALFKSWFVDFDPVHANAGRSGVTTSSPSEFIGDPAVDKSLDSRLRGNDGLLPAELSTLFPNRLTESPLGMVPEGWRVGTLNDVAIYQNGYAFKTKDWRESGHPVFKIGNVKPGIIDASACSYVASEVVVGLDRFRLSRGDLLVGMTGYVGETGLVPDIEPAAYLNQRVGRISTSDGIKNLGFVYCLVRNPAYKVYAESKGHGSAQANVSGTDLMAYRAMIPSPDILAAFNDHLHPLIEKILGNHDQIQTLATLRDTLLPRLISGQLRLPEAEAALGEVG